MRVEQHETESVSRFTTGRRDAVRRDCGHPGIPHAHGTRIAYVSDRCGCTRCRAANRAAEEHRTAAIAVGRWSPYADAQPVREHLERLRQEGLGVERIARLSNVSRGTVRRLLSYPSEPGARPHRIRAATAQRLLALPVTAEVGSPRRVVDVSATRARIDALTAAGHSLTELARAIGKHPSSLRRSLSRQSVTAQTATAVEVMYAALCKETPRDQPLSYPSDQAAVLDRFVQHATCRQMNEASSSTRVGFGVGHRHLRDRNVKRLLPVLHAQLGSLDLVKSRLPPIGRDQRQSGGRPPLASRRENLHEGSVPQENENSNRVGVSGLFLQSQPASIACMAHRPGPGRKSKGDRDNFAVKPMRPVGDVIRANADRLGMTYGEYCAAILSNALGMPEYAPQPIAIEQQELPLKTA